MIEEIDIELQRYLLTLGIFRIYWQREAQNGRSVVRGRMKHCIKIARAPETH